MTAPTEAPEALTALLAQHHRRDGLTMTGRGHRYRCACGEIVASHAAHLAAVLTAAGWGRLPDATTCVTYLPAEWLAKHPEAPWRGMSRDKALGISPNSALARRTVTTYAPHATEWEPVADGEERGVGS